MKLLRAILGLAILGSLLPAQDKPGTGGSDQAAPTRTGWRVVRFSQADPKAPRLAAVVCYPARVSEGEKFRERDARIQTREGGYPVLVILHGLAGSGGQMRTMGAHFARHGYIAVLTDTTRFDRNLQARNGRAFFQALKLCNADDASFLHRQLDTSRVGIGGHSMGGGNSVRVLADNPGYKAGFCFAPWTTHIGTLRRTRTKSDYSDTYAPKVRVPLGVLHGIRDRVLPWRDNAMRLFKATQADKTAKVLWVLDESATHINIALARSSSRRSSSVLTRCLEMATAFFDAHVRGQPEALQRYLDPKKLPKGVLQLHSNQPATDAGRPQRSKQSARVDEPGAPGHWAYQVPVRPTPPANQDPWIHNPIDAFILARLQAAGRRPASTATRQQLLRRVYLDLIGLPPSIAEVDAFVTDRSPDAFSKVVDRLLASPRFGEQWARHWLDLARYADSNGFQADQLRDSWAYRDWVIGALNQDMPFDTFTTHQIAGDLLPTPTPASQIATGFHRTVTCNVEAGVHPEANRVNQIVDRVNTTATVWLGTTLSCAQCHDHKYDPLSQQDYFELFAFFNNTPIEVRNPSGKGVSFDFYGPKMDLPLRPAQQQLRTKLTTQLAQARTRHQDVTSKAGPEFRAWRARMAAAVRADSGFEPLRVARFSSTGDEDVQILEDHSVLVGGRVPSTATYTVEIDTDMTGITAFRVEALTHPSLPGTGPGRGDVARPNFILSELSVTAQPRVTGNGAANLATAAVKLRDARADYSQKKWPVSAAIDGDPRKGWAIGGGFFKDHWATFATQSPVGYEGGTHLTFTLDQNFGRGRTIGRFRVSAFAGDPAALGLPPAIVQLLKKPRHTPANTRRLRTHFLANYSAAKRAASEIQELKARLKAIKPPTTLVMVEQDKPRTTQVMRRGDYLSPGKTVQPATPAALHGFKPEWPRNRLGLARWLVSPDNPLTARVTANRLWSQLFGRGIVVTEEDFGLRGQAPSHPGLLDWLAVEFIESGWSLKELLRTIVTSATYQQDSRRDPQDEDHYNTLYGRGPRFRLSAESIRDNALAVAGLLVHETGGPPVYPPQPTGLWRQTGRNEPKYKVSQGADRFRRGVYVVWRRAAPYPGFVLFDGPDRSSCHPIRSRTNTPMQALTLMNGLAFAEAAAGLADRVLRERPDASVAQRIEHAFRLALARRPRANEAAHLVAAYHEQKQILRAQPDKARDLLLDLKAVPLSSGAATMDLAAWIHVATILLNLDETITKG